MKGQQKKRGNPAFGHSVASASTSSVDPPTEQKCVDEHPWELGHFLRVKYRDGSERRAVIIERSALVPSPILVDADENRSSNSSDASSSSSSSSSPPASDRWQYYIHYCDFNRRMDEWIRPSRVVDPPSVANVAEEKRKMQDKDHDDLNSSLDIKDDLAYKKRNLNENGDHEGPTTVAELDHDEHEGMDEAALKEHEEVTKIKNVQNVVLGRHIMECWYFSPFPHELFMSGPLEYLYFCEFTLRFFVSKAELIRYQNKPGLPRHPPGNEICRDQTVSMFEVDGGVEKIYCQNLCYFAKLFLDHKTLVYDVDAFLFYVLCTQDNRGYHPVGFFSKEKFSDIGYNLACILTFPSAQRKGFGRFLIGFSYELTKVEEKVGAPEKPLSDLGAVSYKSYWASTILTVLKTFSGSQLSIMDLCKMTSFTAKDTIATLQHLGLLQTLSNGSYVICAPMEVVDTLILKYPVKGHQVDPGKLHWAPLYVMDWKKDKFSIRYICDSNYDI